MSVEEVRQDQEVRGGRLEERRPPQLHLQPFMRLLTSSSPLASSSQPSCEGQR